MFPLKDILVSYRLGFTFERSLGSDFEAILLKTRSLRNPLEISLHNPDIVKLKSGKAADSNKLCRGDVIAPLRFTSFSAAYLADLPANSAIYTSNNLAVLHPKPNVSSSYLALALRSYDVRDQLEQLATFRNADGTMIWGDKSTPTWKLTLRNLGDVQIPVPSLEQQACAVSHWHNMVAAHEQARLQIQLEERRFWDDLSRCQ